MKKWITGATFAVALIGFASQASASTELLAGGGQAPDVFSTAGFTLQASNTGQLLNSGTFTATASAWVYSDTANVFCSGCLDFVYQVTRTGGTDPIEGLNSGSFAGFRTDAGYATTTGTTPPTKVDRSAGSGIVVTFELTGANQLTGNPQASYLLVVETDALFAKAGNFTVTDTLSANGSGFIPTLVPEPMTFSLMGAGLLGFGLLRKRISRS